VALSKEHQEYLSAQAVDVGLADRLGVQTVSSRADMEATGSDNWVNFANFPAILFPWTSPDGRIMYQARPDNPTKDQKSGKPRKYVFGRGEQPVLWAVREVENPRLIVVIEGTKQCLAGASYAPDDVSVYGIAGCRMWQVDGSPIPDLIVADGYQVVVILDSDAGSNPDVFEAGIGLADALIMEGATKVLFGRLPGGANKSGLDDILAGRPADRRAAYLARVLSGAKAKPADTKPKRTKGGTVPTGGGDRVTIVVNRDRHEVINDLTDALLKRWNARQLFCHGGVISRFDGAGMTPVDKGSFNDIVQSTAMTVNENNGAQGTTYGFAWPDPGTMMAVSSRADRFSPLDRLAHAPFVRPDGSIVTEPGYDETTRTILMPDEVFAGIEVPDQPSPEQITAARELILTEWLGDFPVDDAPDLANLLGLVVTPAIRGMVPRAPLAVIDGLQMGVGKNLLADSILTVYTGQAAQPMNWVDESDELRKQITSAFRTGAEFFIFDEAHTLDGAPLAQALTAETWQDRILGVSTMANFPNRVTWMSLGNNVHVKGDITRRVFRIALRPKYANPQDRAAHTFRHPGTSGLDLLSWTRANRRQLMTAILTLVRAWFAQGQPYPSRGVSFGSFEGWERIVGGIVETAGVPQFLDNLKVWRSESDFDSQYWISHLTWLYEQFGQDEFKTADVKTKALTLGLDNYHAPPKLDDPSEKTYGKSLGEAYARIRSRRYGGYWLDRVRSGHGHVSVYRVYWEGDLPPAPGSEPAPVEPDDGLCPHGVLPEFCGNCHEEGDLPPAPGSEPAPVEPEPRHPAPCGYPDVMPCICQTEVDTETSTSDSGVADSQVDTCSRCGSGLLSGGEHVRTDLAPCFLDECGCSRVMPVYCHARNCQGGADIRPEPEPTEDVVTFDLETGHADDLYRTPGTEYVRIGATAIEDGPVSAFNDAVSVSVVDDIRTGKTITGHNIMAFDLPALVRAGALTMPEVHRLADDGRLFDALLVARYLDPPMARDKGVDATRKYNLGALGEQYGLGHKMTEVSHGLDKKYGGWANIPIDDSEDGRAFKAYMVQDVELSRRLHATLLEKLGGTVPEYVVREHRVAALAAQISINGFLVDQKLLTERVDAVNDRKREAMETLSSRYGVPTTDAKGIKYKSPLASKAGKEAVEKALIEAGVPGRALWRTPKSEDLQISADAMLHYGREYGQNNPGLRDLVKSIYRIVSARSVYQTAQDYTCPDGRVHPQVGFDQATGRWSVTRPGLTVFGKRGGRHVERAIFLPDPGQVLLSADLSQVDMRALAGLSQDAAYIEMLKHEDPHAEIAKALFGDVARREDAKAIGHGWNYRRGIKAISQGQDIPLELVQQFDRSMRERFPRLVMWQEEVTAIAESGALLDNGWGRMMRPDPQRAYTQGPALMGQGAARDIMMHGMLQLPAEFRPMLRAQIHDEIVLAVPEKDAEEIGREVVKALSFEWRGVPILADVSRAGTDWSLCYAKG